MNFASTELMLIVGVVAVFAVVLGRIFRTPGHVASAIVSGDPDQTVNDFVIALSEVRNSRVSLEGPRILSVEHGVVPGWAIVCAVILFPFGLLALLARKGIQGAVVVEPANDYPGMTRVRVSGDFTSASARAMDRFVSSRVLPSYATS